MDQNWNTIISRIRLDDRLTKLAISASGFVFDPQTGQSFTLNETALAALDVLKSGASLQSAAQTLSERYDVPFEVAETSLCSFVIQLGRYL